MSEEEKKAIGILRFSKLIRGRKPENDAVEILVNLIEKLKKENEDREQAHMKLYNEFRQYKDWDSIPKEKIREKIEELKNQIEILKAMPEYENRKLEAIINVANLENIIFYLENQVLEEE